MFSYVRNPEKTDNGEYVSAVNCLKETALEQMILTKKQYQKSGGYIAWHGYQSFKPNEVTPEQCHEIGLKLAREMWGDKYRISLIDYIIIILAGAVKMAENLHLLNFRLLPILQRRYAVLFLKYILKI